MPDFGLLSFEVENGKPNNSMVSADIPLLIFDEYKVEIS